MDISIDEKRVYDGSDESVPVYVVGEFGVAAIETSDDLVGEFGLKHQCTARDAAGRDGRLAVATDEDVLVATGDGFGALGVGPAVAVGFGTDGDLVAALGDGRVIRERGDSWTELGEVADARAVDGDFLAGASGVYRATSGGLRQVGLNEARDVSAAETPLAATDDGLYRLGNGWLAELEGAFRAVSASPAGADQTASAGDLGEAHAATDAALFEFAEGAWRTVSLPVEEAIVALDRGSDGAYAMTAEGTFLLSVGDGWRSQPVGLRESAALAVP
ncbi:HVO_0234 family beta-propeller protein [Halorussus marinus]|uniref:HVO_0234 family beta-propeller protein n=1 Tax=Halorussus marinus TaxID=2505976 RepID=UPI001092C327|nr:hypothetical protein [Halorussus marinus]